MGIQLEDSSCQRLGGGCRSPDVFNNDRFSHHLIFLCISTDMNALEQGSSRPRHPGLGHWRWQRASAMLLAPLILWTLWLSQSLDPATYGSALAWVDGAGPTSALLILTPVWYLHGSLGLQIVIEDYVRAPHRSLLIWLVRVGAVFLTIATAWAVLAIK